MRKLILIFLVLGLAFSSNGHIKMKTSSKLFKLQHAEALEITKILDEVINNQKQIKQKLQKNSIPNVGQKNTAAKPPTPGSPKTNNTQSTPGAGNADGGDSSHEFSDFISISADERSNAILVYGTKGDIEEVGKMISSLDEPLPLARIDTIFVMVDLSEQNQRGIDALFGGLEWSKYARGERDRTSENNDRLKGWLKKFPEADKNKDGVLTGAEALEFIRIKKGGNPNRKKKAPEAKTISGENVPAGKAIKGYNGLFMGHSFFKPAAEHLLKVIPDTNVVNHTEYIVMSGGASGSPGVLWENKAKRDLGLKYLDTKKVEFFAMTYYSQENSSVVHYSKWFDYAISKNPKVTFMVALPWRGHLYKATKEELAKAESGYKKHYDNLIVPLRKKYPNNKIIYCPYGLGVYELINRLNNDNLAGVKHILNPDRNKNAKDQILKDPLGHGTDLVTVLNSLVWLQTIYKYDISTIKKKFRVEGLPGINLNEIAAKIYEKIKPYNEAYK